MIGTLTLIILVPFSARANNLELATLKKGAALELKHRVILPRGIAEVQIGGCDIKLLRPTPTDRNVAFPAGRVFKLSKDANFADPTGWGSPADLAQMDLEDQSAGSISCTSTRLSIGKDLAKAAGAMVSGVRNVTTSDISPDFQVFPDGEPDNI